MIEQCIAGRLVRRTTTVVELERTECCFADCPAYTVSLSAAGDFTWQEHAHVRTLGPDHGFASDSAVADLLETFRRSDVSGDGQIAI
ncbi:MAG TPA: DUF6438 domain-containing protein [Polyangiaceae bacterium]|nr:DUF6438 domain-containing protein [Polyangiaceae bacterium]